MISQNCNVLLVGLFVDSHTLLFAELVCARLLAERNDYYARNLPLMSLIIFDWLFAGETPLWNTLNPLINPAMEIL